MLDPDKKKGIKAIQLYLSTSESSQFIKELEKLLVNPEHYDHFHFYSEDMACEISCSIFTDKKIKEGKYTKLEKSIL